MEGEYHIVTDPTVPPVQHAQRKTPIELYTKIEAKLDEMERDGVIMKTTEPTEWVNSMTYPMKPNGDIWMCLDPKDLNHAIIREHYKPPTLEEITHKLSGATVFSKLDAYHAFWAVKLDHESSLKTTFNTIPSRGRYRYLCLTMGTKNSQDVYQMRIDQALEGLEGVVAIHNDITVYGKDDEDHDKNLLALMQRAKEKGLTFNSKKCSIRQEQINRYPSLESPSAAKA